MRQGWKQHYPGVDNWWPVTQPNLARTRTAHGRQPVSPRRRRAVRRPGQLGRQHRVRAPGSPGHDSPASRPPRARPPSRSGGSDGRQDLRARRSAPRPRPPSRAVPGWPSSSRTSSTRHRGCGVLGHVAHGDRPRDRPAVQPGQPGRPADRRGLPRRGAAVRLRQRGRAGRGGVIVAGLLLGLRRRLRRRRHVVSGAAGHREHDAGHHVRVERGVGAGRRGGPVRPSGTPRPTSRRRSAGISGACP